jgi:small subunit ribosomal protein S6
MAGTRYPYGPTMTRTADTYDLTLLLDPQAEADVRAKIVADTGAAIGAQGELLRHDEWGERPLAYQIAHRTSAEYHLFQFHATTTALLDELERTLRITDGVLRLRLIKLRPGVPAAPDMRAGAAARRGESEARAQDAGERAGQGELAAAEHA